MNYKEKYQKYKEKYLKLKMLEGGSSKKIFLFDIDDCIYYNECFRARLGFGLCMNIYNLYVSNENNKNKIDTYIQNSDDIMSDMKYTPHKCDKCDKLAELIVPDDNVELFSKLNNLEFKLYRAHGTSYVGLLQKLKFKKDELKQFYSNLYDFLNNNQSYNLIKRDEEFVNFIEKIKKKYDVFYFTNGDNLHATKILQSIGIPFENSDIYSITNLNNPDDDSEESFSKPSIEYYRRLKTRLVKKFAEKNESSNLDIIFFEDTVNNLITAKNMNWRTVLVRKGTEQEIIKWKTDFNHHFNTLDEMIKHFNIESNIEKFISL